jgi:hypothetical protein
VLSTGKVTTLAGDPNNVNSFPLAYTNSPDPTLVEFPDLYGLTTDGTNLYLCDPFAGAIRQVSIATGATTTLAGPADAVPYYKFGNVDGIGPAVRTVNPVGIITDGSALYFTDSFSNTIRVIH